MKVSIIGCGKMGGALAEGLAKEHTLSLYDHHPETSKTLAKHIGATVAENAERCISQGELVILAVKPHDLEPLASEIRDHLSSNQLILSVLASTPSEVLQKQFPNNPVVRTMPNIAVRYGKGVIGLVSNHNEQLKKKIEDALQCLGQLHWIPEHQIDALSAITGSGPAFLFVIIESIIDAGIAMGFSTDKSKELALQLMMGSHELLQQSGKHPGELKWEVTSPKGTTIAGIQTMEEYGIRTGIIQTFLSTYERAKNL